MKSKIINLAVLNVFVLLAIGMNAQAAQLVPLDSREAALVGATHVARFTYEDFAASTDTNTALVITNLSPIAAKEQVECVGMVLETSFDTGNTNYTGGMALKVGDSSDDDLFLASTELASDGSEVFVKSGRTDAETITSTVTKQVRTFLTGLTLQTVSLTDTNGITALAVTNIVSASDDAVTNATVASSAAAGVLGKKVYTAANYLKFTFTPNSEEALSANTKGAVLVYFRKLK
jgi:hypothetical protein